MNKEGIKNKEIRRRIIILLLIVLFFSSCLFFLFRWEKGLWPFPSKNAENTLLNTGSTITYQNKTYHPKLGVETFLIMGLDKFEQQINNADYYNDQQADFIALLVVDNSNQTYSAIHIDRDTMVDVDVLGVTGQVIKTEEMQLALAHTYGNGGEVSCQNTSKSVSKLLRDTKIDHYLSITMDAVAILNDMVDGVEVTVLDDFTGIDDTLVKGQTVTLKGEQALRYVRTRYGMEDSSNRSRMARQQQYLTALLKKTNERIATDDSFIVDATLATADYVVTNHSLLTDMLNKLSTYTFTEIRAMDGDYFKGERFIEFYPDQDSVNQIILDLFYDPEE